MTCVRSCGYLFRFAFANNAECYSVARRLNVNLTPSTPSRLIFRNLRGLKSDIKSDESSEKSDSAGKRLEESKSVALTDETPFEIELIKEEPKSVEGILNNIKMNKDNINVDSSQYYLRKVVHLYKNKKTNLSLEEIQNSEELFLLLKTCQKHLGSFHTDNLVQILIDLRRLGVPERAVIMLQLLRILKEDFNNLSFVNACSLFNYIEKNSIESADAKAIKIALKETLPLKFKETFDRKNKYEVQDALWFLAEFQSVLSPCAVEICDAVVEMCESEGDEFSTNVINKLLQALKYIGKEDPRLKKIFLMAFNIVKKIALMDLPNNRASSVLYYYAFFDAHKYMEYDEMVVNNLGKKVIESGIPAYEKLTITNGLNKMRHNQIEVADHFADLAIADPRFLMDHNSVRNFIRYLFNTNFINLKKDKWEKLKPIIKSLPILTDESLWDNGMTGLVIDLIGLDIFPDKILRMLSEKYNSGKILEESWAKIKLLVAINQAVNLWHPNFGKPVLSEETIGLIIQYYQQRLQEMKPWTAEVKTFLEQATGVENSVFLYCYSPQGILCQEVMVLDKKNKPIPLSGLQNTGPLSIKYLRSRLKTEKLVLILNFGKKSYSANYHNLFSLASITVKALEEQGFFVVPLLQDDWFQLDERERGLYLWNCIQEKMPDSWKSRPTALDKFTEITENMKDSVVSSAKRVSNFGNFFNR